MPATTPRVVLLFFIALPALCYRAASADVSALLRCAPDEAAAFVIIPHIDAAARGVARFGTMTGIEPLARLDAARLLERSNQLGSAAGIDLSGPLAIIDHPLLGEGVACGLTDVAAWKQANGAVEYTGGLLQVRAFADQRLAWIKRDVLVISGSREYLEAAQAGTGALFERWTKATKAQAPNHVCFYADVAPWRAYLHPGVFVLRQGMKAGMLSSAGSSVQAAMDLWDSVFDSVAGAIDAAECVHGGLDLSEKGVNANVAILFAEDSGAVRYLKSVQPSDHALLRGLPKGDVMLAFAAEWKLADGQPGVYGQLTRALVVGSPLREKLGAEKFDQALKLMESTAESVSGYNTSVRTLSGGEMLIVGYNLTDKPDEVMGSIRKAQEISPELVNAYITGMQTTGRSQTIEAGDARIEAFPLDFAGIDPQMRTAFEQIYGKAPGFFLVPARYGVFYAVGPWAPTRAAIEAGLREQEASQLLADDERVLALAKRFDPHPQLFVLADLPRTFDALLTIARRLGAPTPGVTLPPTATPYAGAAIHLESQQLRTSAFVPAEAAQALWQSFESLRKMHEHDPRHGVKQVRK